MVCQSEDLLAHCVGPSLDAIRGDSWDSGIAPAWSPEGSGFNSMIYRVLPPPEGCLCDFQLQLTKPDRISNDNDNDNDNNNVGANNERLYGLVSPTRVFP